MGRSLVKNTIWGLRWGLAFAGVYCLWIIGLYLFRGPSVFADRGVTLPAVIAAYLFGGVAAGAIVGLLRPLAKWKFGAAIVGIVAGIPVGLGIVYAIMGISPWTGEHSFVLAWIALLGGGSAGFLMRAISDS